MKKLLLILFIIGLTGALCSAALCGQILNNEMKVYEDYQNKNLDIKALDNIIVESSVDTYIHTTDGTPYVEFNQKFIDVLGNHPSYTLTVETKNNVSYIKLIMTHKTNHLYFVTEDSAALNIYLPQQAINKLHINNNNETTLIKNTQNVNLNLQDIDIKDLDINAFRLNASLSGNYERVAIDANHGSVNLSSNSTSHINIDGGINSSLTGSFNNINISTYGNQLFIDSHTPASVSIDGGSDIKLKGSYNQIEIKAGYDSILDINSNTLCKVNIDGNSSKLNLNGAFDTLTINGDNKDIYINTTNIPQLINILEFSQMITVMLPSNTPGINANCIWADDGLHTHFTSDFPMQQHLDSHNVAQYFFGNKQVKLFIKAWGLQDIYVLDNGYLSKDVSENIESEEAIPETSPVESETHPMESREYTVQDETHPDETQTHEAQD